MTKRVSAAVRIERVHEDWKISCDAGPHETHDRVDVEVGSGGQLYLCPKHFTTVFDAIAKRRKKLGL